MEINIIPKFLDSALTPVAKEAGERLADIVSLLFTPLIKVKAKRDKNIELFLQDLNKKVDDIPEEKVKNPPLSIVGPILDLVYKYYHDEEHLRKMFANLIASSMNVDNDVHPRYINIISQLSHNDAILFTAFLGSQSFPNRRFGFHALSFLEIACNVGNDELNKSITGLKYFISENKAFVVTSSFDKSLDWLQQLRLINFSRTIVSAEILSDYNIVVKGQHKNSIIVRVLTSYVSQLGSDFAELCCESACSDDIFKKTDCLSELILKDDGFEAISKKAGRPFPEDH